MTGCSQQGTPDKQGQAEQKSKQEIVETQDDGSSGEVVPDCSAFPSKLHTCDAFSCTFKHPFTGELVERKIIGLENGTCQYSEEMPNNGQMNCAYPEDMRKAVAQYYADIAPTKSTSTSIKIDLQSGQAKTTYTIDGKEVNNPLQEALNNGQCTISGYDDLPQDDNSSLQDTSNGGLEVEWGDFVKTKNRRDEDAWEMEIKITNNHNKKVILDLVGTGKERNWSWGVENTLDSGESKRFKVNINHYFFDEVAFDQKDITIIAYECGKLSESIEEELCVSGFGLGGKLSPWEILGQKEELGTPIEPTFISTKYFDYNSQVLPPSEISQEEYLQYSDVSVADKHSECIKYNTGLRSGSCTKDAPSYCKTVYYPPSCEMCQDARGCGFE